MSFKPDELDPNTDFSDARITPQWVVGRGQNVYWKECSVSVVEKDSEGKKKVTTFDHCDGQWTVPSGIDLYLAGQGGIVKEK